MDLHELNNLDKEYETNEEGNDCPECEGKLVKRYARTFEGGEFLGCSKYPR